MNAKTHLLKDFFQLAFYMFDENNLLYSCKHIHASFTWQEHPIVFVKLLKFSIVLYTKDTCFGNNIE